MMDFFANPFERKICNKGLSNIHKPHNLTNVKDEAGKIVAQKLTVVTTPFKKDDVKVKIVDDVLTVTCGTENVKDEENEEVIYRTRRLLRPKTRTDCLRSSSRSWS